MREVYSDENNRATPSVHAVEVHLLLLSSVWGEGGQMAERLGSRAFNQKVVGSIPSL